MATDDQELQVVVPPGREYGIIDTGQHDDEVEFTGADYVRMAREVSPAFARIVDEIIPRFIEDFAQHALDYEDNADDLGPKGQYADIHGKVRKLRRAVWDGKPLVGESPQRIAKDIAAHCFLMLEMFSSRPTPRQ